MKKNESLMNERDFVVQQLIHSLTKTTTKNYIITNLLLNIILKFLNVAFIKSMPTKYVILFLNDSHHQQQQQHMLKEIK